MKLSQYYLAIFSPFLIILLLLKLNFATAFVLSLLVYYVYRCFLDYYKLKTNNIVSKKDIWKFIIPIWTFIYFEDLYFK